MRSTGARIATKVKVVTCLLRSHEVRGQPWRVVVGPEVDDAVRFGVVKATMSTATHTSLPVLRAAGRAQAGVLLVLAARWAGHRIRDGSETIAIVPVSAGLDVV